MPGHPQYNPWPLRIAAGVAVAVLVGLLGFAFWLGHHTK